MLSSPRRTFDLHLFLGVLRLVFIYLYVMHFARCFGACTGVTLSCLGLSLFLSWAVWVDFSADLAKKWRKNSWDDYEVRKNYFCLFYLFGASLSSFSFILSTLFRLAP